MDVYNLRTLANKPINIENLGNIYSPTLDKIAEISEDKYNYYLSILLFEINQIKNNFNDEDCQKIVDNYTVFEFMSQKSLYDESFRSLMLDALSFFFCEEVKFYNGVFYFDENRVFNNENFKQMRYILKFQNCIEDKKDNEEKFVNDKAREIAEKLKQAKEKINKIKAKQGEVLSLFDLISAFSANSKNTGILDVWKLSIYQFNDQFKRMQIIEEYDINIRSLLAGADPKKINIEHWAKKIQK